MKTKSIIVVHDGRAVEISPAAWQVFCKCAAQMLDGPDAREYYKGIVAPAVIRHAQRALIRVAPFGANVERRPGPLPGKQPGA